MLEEGNFSISHNELGGDLEEGCSDRVDLFKHGVVVYDNDLE
jgi:hypothetical protein